MGIYVKQVTYGVGMRDEAIVLKAEGPIYRPQVKATGADSVQLRSSLLQLQPRALSQTPQPPRRLNMAFMGVIYRRRNCKRRVILS